MLSSFLVVCYNLQWKKNVENNFSSLKISSGTMPKIPLLSIILVNICLLLFVFKMQPFCDQLIHEDMSPLV